MKHLLLAGLLLIAVVAWGQETTPLDAASAPGIAPPAPVTNLQAKDSPNDHGHAVTLTWSLSADDGGGAQSVKMYEILRAASADGPFAKVGTTFAGQTEFEHSGPKEKDAKDYYPDYTDFYYQVHAVTLDTTVRTASATAGPVQSYGQWFNFGRVPVFIAVLVFGGLTVLFVSIARQGRDLYVRPLAGIEAVDEAIGRATEMGKPILYVLGLGTASEIATIASFTILGRVAKKVAEYQTHLIVPTYDPIVMSVAQETVKASYMDAGRPDAYNEDMVFFVTQNQFAYVSAINGIMLRQKPATNLYLGKFFAESLILAETGAVAGAIQISGTDEVAQIPFFVVATDYTLIGEELFAASAYLGREPLLLGSLKAQDWAKAAVIILMVLGALAMNLDIPFREYFAVVD